MPGARGTVVLGHIRMITCDSEPNLGHLLIGTFSRQIFICLSLPLNTVSSVSLRPLSDKFGILNLCGSVYVFCCLCQFLCRVSYFFVCLITFGYGLNIISEKWCLEIIWSLGWQYIPSERTLLATKYACFCQVTRGTIRMGPAESKFKAWVSLDHPGNMILGYMFIQVGVPS